jgi:hypothetical protein
MPSQDTFSTSTLDYAASRTDMPDRVPGQRLLSLGVALAVALLCFNALSDAAGFTPLPPNLDRADPGSVFLHVLCGLTGGVLAFAFMRFAFIQGRAIVRSLHRTVTAPGQAVAFALLGVGSGCIVIAAVTQLLAGRSNSGLAMQYTVNGATIGVVAQPPLVTEVLVLLTFLVGAALVALGVWCCFQRNEAAAAITQPSMTTPPVARGDGLPPIPSSQQSAA